MTIDVAELRAETEEIAEVMRENLGPPGTGKWPAVACIILLAIYYEVRKIRRLIKKDD